MRKTKKHYKKIFLILSLIMVFGCIFLVGIKGAHAAMQRLRISDNGRFLEKEDGTPFFWMGDTAWSIATINPSDMAYYMNDRAQKGFSIIQIDADSYGAPNYAGQRPFKNENPGATTNPNDWVNEVWWQYLDSIISEAENRGIYVCLMNMWGAVLDADRNFWGGYLRFGNNTTKAYNFGKWLGNRYKDKTNVIWSVSGEYAAVNKYIEPITASQKALFNAVAQGLEDAHGGSQIMTIHSGDYFRSAAWHNFTMIQSGHKPDNTAIGRLETYEDIAANYGLTPIKPVVDGEMVYEAYPDITPAVVRRKTYWSVFAGGLGVTYGHVCIETMNNPYGTFANIPDICRTNGRWKDTLNAPGGSQMQYLRFLMESVSDYLGRIPDQSIIVSGIGSGITHVQATRDAEGKYALVYIPDGHNVTVNMAKISGLGADASWYNPRTGEYAAIGNFPNSGSRVFDPPGATAEGNDWVLVLKKQGNSEKVIQLGDSWNYFKGTFTPNASWKELSFTGSWPDAGPTTIGRGSGYATTLTGIGYTTFYARKNFTIADASAVTSMRLYAGYDDGFVTYINGQEVARSANVTGTPNHTTVTGSSHEVTAVETYDLTAYISSLQNGNNILAIEIHNKDTFASGDIGIAPELEITTAILGSPPVANNQSVTLNEGSSKAITLTASDLESDPLTYRIITQPAHGTLSGTAPNLMYTPNAGYYGTDYFTFKANDGKSDSNEATVSITINRVNALPVFNPVSAKSVNENASLYFKVIATDADGDVLDYSVTNLPEGASFGYSCGPGRLFSWTPTSTQGSVEGRNYVVTFKASDGKSEASQNVTITVYEKNNPPVLTVSGAHTVKTGNTIWIRAQATDLDKTPLQYTVNPLPAGASFYDSKQGYWVLRWAPDAEQGGIYNLSFEVTDGASIDKEDFTVTVYSNNNPPQMWVNAQVSGRVGKEMSFYVYGWDPDLDPVTFLSLNLPQGATFNVSNNRKFIWKPVIGQGGNYIVTFKVKDPAGLEASKDVAISVTENNTAPVFVTPVSDWIIQPGRLIEIYVAAEDADGDALTYGMVNAPSGATGYYGECNGLYRFSWKPTTTDIGEHPNIYFWATDGDLTAETSRIKITVAQ